MSDQMAVCEVEEYAEDGIEPSMDQVVQWAVKHKEPSEWAELFFDQMNTSVVGVCTQMLMDKQDGSGLMSVDDIRCISVATMLRGQMERIAFQYWQDECKSFLDNGGEL